MKETHAGTLSRRETPQTQSTFTPAALGAAPLT